MTTRIYKVVGPSGTKLVEAGTQAGAINHVVRADYKATVASAKDVAYSGMKVEKAGDEALDTSQVAGMQTERKAA